MTTTLLTTAPLPQLCSRDTTTGGPLAQPSELPSIASKVLCRVSEKGPPLPLFGGVESAGDSAFSRAYEAAISGRSTGNDPHHGETPRMTRADCTACGTRHDVLAHHDPDAMDREARAAEGRGDVVNAAVWRARASSTRAGNVLR